VEDNKTAQNQVRINSFRNQITKSQDQFSKKIWNSNRRNHQIK